MKALNGFGFISALEDGFNPKRTAGNNNSGNWNRFITDRAYLSPAGE
ncbi:MAG: hypothetical protein J5732_04395 [Bacteroidaceae bacterium]|nr:hypothetical protein [Bacteroidaceae bacterium]